MGDQPAQAGSADGCVGRSCLASLVVGGLFLLMTIATQCEAKDFESMGIKA
jgi:hypothetical protein